MSELVVVSALCACSLIAAASQARGLSGRGARQREIDRLLGAVERACADFLWQETRLIALLLLVVGAALAAPMVLWNAALPEREVRWGLGALGLIGGAAGGAGVAQVARWAAARATASSLAALREDPDAASSAVFRGALVSALIVDAASLLLSLGVFAAHYAYLIWAARFDRAAAVLEAARSSPAAALGATCAALIFQVGGSSFHTAAGVAGAGARARDRSIARDDEQNPALVAELVGDYVGGSVYRSTDMFCTLVLGNSALLLLASSVARANPSLVGGALALVALPLIVRATGLLATTVSLSSLRFDTGSSAGRAFVGAGVSHAVVAATGAFGAASWLLGSSFYLSAFAAGALGIVASLVAQGLLLAQAQSLGTLSSSHARVPALSPASVARALGFGLQRAWSPLLVAGVCLGAAYGLGSRTGFAQGGALGLLLAVAAMLGAGALHLCASSFASIGESVRRIVSLRRARFDLAARSRAAELDRWGLAIGNLGHTQGILGGTAAALLGALTLPLLPAQDATPGIGIGIGHPMVILGGILGAASLLFYVGGVLKNSSRATSALDGELAAELGAREASLDGEMRTLPRYRGSVELAASAATEALLPLAAAAVLAPIALGVLLRLVYGGGRAALAAHGLMAYASIAVLTGCFAALAAQGALLALGHVRPESAAENAGTGGGPGLLEADSAREFMGRSVGPAALLGLKATVVSALVIAPLLA